VDVRKWTSQFTIFVVCLVALTVFQIATMPRPDHSLRSMDVREFQAYWTEHIPTQLEEYGVEGAAIMVLEDGQPAFRGAFGHADVADDTPMTLDAVTMAHSISKSVTAWGVMTLVARGKIDLDEPVTSYLPDFDFPESNYPVEEITVRRLLSLNAGIPLGEFGVHYEPDEDRPELRQMLQGDAVRLRRPPGSAFEYSNNSFALLELLVEEVSGQDFANYMDEHVLDPLGMMNASFDWQASWEGRVPMGYTLSGEPVPPYLYAFRASGGLYATIDDLGQFASASLGHSNGVLSAAQIAQMHRPQVSIPGMFGVVADSYGLGHFLETLPDGKAAVWHGGQGLGWMTHFHVVPSTGDGIVIIANSQRSWPLFARLLDEWSTWAGIGEPGMARIIKSTVGMRILIGLIMLLTLWTILRVVHGTAIGTRHLTGRQRPDATQFVSGIAAVCLLAGLAWASLQDYLFIRSIFPDGSIWLGTSLFALALALASAALLPEDR
jgi:CubicO group peptidase (beta-lactamase class C family)